MDLCRIYKDAAFEYYSKINRRTRELLFISATCAVWLLYQILLLTTVFCVSSSSAFDCGQVFCKNVFPITCVRHSHVRLFNSFMLCSPREQSFEDFVYTLYNVEKAMCQLVISVSNQNSLLSVCAFVTILITLVSLWSASNVNFDPWWNPIKLTQQLTVMRD